MAAAGLSKRDVRADPEDEEGDGAKGHARDNHAWERLRLAHRLAYRQHDADPLEGHHGLRGKEQRAGTEPRRPRNLSDVLEVALHEVRADEREDDRDGAPQHQVCHCTARRGRVTDVNGGGGSGAPALCRTEHWPA